VSLTCHRPGPERWAEGVVATTTSVAGFFFVPVIPLTLICLCPSLIVLGIGVLSVYENCNLTPTLSFLVCASILCSPDPSVRYKSWPLPILYVPQSRYHTSFAGYPLCLLSLSKRNSLLSKKNLCKLCTDLPWSSSLQFPPTSAFFLITTQHCPKLLRLAGYAPMLFTLTPKRPSRYRLILSIGYGSDQYPILFASRKLQVILTLT